MRAVWCSHGSRQSSSVKSFLCCFNPATSCALNSKSRDIWLHKSVTKPMMIHSIQKLRSQWQSRAARQKSIDATLGAKSRLLIVMKLHHLGGRENLAAIKTSAGWTCFDRDSVLPTM